MQVQKALLTALLAAAGLAVFADDAQAIGRRKKKAANDCGGCQTPVAVAPAPCGGCGGGYGAASVPGTYVGSAGVPVEMAGYPGGNVIVSGEAVPNPMAGTTTGIAGSTNVTTIPTTSIPGTNVIPATTYPAGNVVYPNGTVMPATQFGGHQGGVIQTSGYSPYGSNMYGTPYGSQTFQGGFQSGVMSGALGTPQSYTPGTTISGAVGNYAGNAVSRGLFRRR